MLKVNVGKDVDWDHIPLMEEWVMMIMLYLYYSYRRIWAKLVKLHNKYGDN